MTTRGDLYAYNANIKGTIQADSGYFNNATIDNCTMTNCSISAAQITSGQFGTTRIADNAITSAKISVDSLSAINANLGTVTAGKINMSSPNEIEFINLTNSTYGWTTKYTSARILLPGLTLMGDY